MQDSVLGYINCIGRQAAFWLASLKGGVIFWRWARFQHQACWLYSLSCCSSTEGIRDPLVCLRIVYAHLSHTQQDCHRRENQAPKARLFSGEAIRSGVGEQWLEHAERIVRFSRKGKCHV